MNGLDLYNFMYDQFVWPKYPFASRDMRTMNEREPRDMNERGVPYSPDASPADDALTSRPSRSLIVLADRRRDKT